MTIDEIDNISKREKAEMIEIMYEFSQKHKENHTNTQIFKSIQNEHVLKKEYDIRVLESLYEWFCYPNKHK